MNRFSFEPVQIASVNAKGINAKSALNVTYLIPDVGAGLVDATIM